MVKRKVPTDKASSIQNPKSMAPKLVALPELAGWRT
jgi:hypothetical protein